MLELIYDFEQADLAENIELKDQNSVLHDLKSTCTFKNISYVTPYGNVRGNITISKDIITFNPTNMEEIQQLIAQSDKQFKAEHSSPTKKKPLIKMSDFYLNIEMFDIYSISTIVEEFDSMKNYYDIVLNIYLETANGMPKPLQDAHKNKYLLKVTFKTSIHYSQIDIEELQKRLRELAAKREHEVEDIQQQEIDTQDTLGESTNYFLNRQSEQKISPNKQENLISQFYENQPSSQQFEHSSINEIKTNKQTIQNNVNHKNNPESQQQIKNLNKTGLKQKAAQPCNANNSHACTYSKHLSIKNIDVAEKSKKIKLYSIVGFTFIHFLEIKLRYLINEMGYEDNSHKESGTFVFFYEKVFYKYVHQNNYSHTYELNNEYVPVRNEDSLIFTKNDRQFTQIIQNLPSHLQHSDWSLSYSPIKHGYSYNEFLFRCSASLGPHIVVIRDFQDNIFGAFVSHGWKRSRYFYGDGETFLFKFEHIDQLNEKKLKTFRWTGENNNIQYCGIEGIALGTGENYGLFINKDFYKGLSFPTTTFGNKLGLHIQNNNEIYDNNKKVSIEGEYQIKDIEFWSLDPYHDQKMNQIKKQSLLHPEEEKK